MAQCLEHLRREMLASSGTKVNACERALHREDVGHVLQFLVQGDSRCGFFGFLNAESRVVIAEVLVHLSKNEWENATFSRIVLIIASVHEDVLFSRVAVKIAEEYEASLLMNLLDQALCMEDCRV